MIAYNIIDIFIHDLLQSGVVVEKDIGISIGKSVFTNCTAQYGAAIYSICKFLKVYYVCCYNCHASSSGSFLLSKESIMNECNDTSCCLCSRSSPAIGDTFDIGNGNEGLLKRLNFSQNWALSSFGFQCYDLKKFDVGFVTCMSGKGGHATEIYDSPLGELDSLILIENSYLYLRKVTRKF